MKQPKDYAEESVVKDNFPGYNSSEEDELPPEWLAVLILVGFLSVFALLVWWSISD